MARNPNYEIVEFEGREVRRFENGDLRDENGYLVTRPARLDGHVIRSSERGRELAIRKRDKRIEIMQKAINDMTPKEFQKEYGEMAYVAAVARAAYEKATNTGDPKQIEAARFIFKETGISEVVGNSPEGGDENLSVLASLGGAMVKHILQKARQEE